jgi:hypothetical protein
MGCQYDTPIQELPVKQSTALTLFSLISALLFSLHLTGDVVFGIERGGPEIRVGVLIIAVYVYGAVGLPGRWAGDIILLLGALGSAYMPVLHTMGRPLGERFASQPGGFWFIWTLLTLGATGLVAAVLCLQVMWNRWRGGLTSRDAAAPAMP